MRGERKISGRVLIKYCQRLLKFSFSFSPFFKRKQVKRITAYISNGKLNQVKEISAESLFFNVSNKELGERGLMVATLSSIHVLLV